MHLKGSGAFCRILEVAFCRILGVCTMPKYNMGGCVLPNLSFLGVFALEQKKIVIVGLRTNISVQVCIRTNNCGDGGVLPNFE